jgi:hypothetical protein
LTEQTPQTGQDQKATNPTAKVSIDAAYAEIADLKAKIESDQKIIGDLTQQLGEANKILEAQEKAKLIGDILPKSNLKIHEVVSLSLDELKAIRTTLDRAAPTGYANVRRATDNKLSDRERGLTIGDCSVVTAKQRGN